MSYLKITLGGKERGLNFKMGTLRRIGELTKDDPLKFNTAVGMGAQYDVIKTIVHAALLCNCDIKGIDPDFTEKDVRDWVDQLDPKEATDIVAAFTKAFAVAVEGDANTQG